MKTKLLPTLTGLTCLAVSTHAAVVFSDSFDYGASDITLNSPNATGWETPSSSLFIYDADGGLDVAQVNGETGGALTMPGAETGQEATTTFTSYPMSNLSADDTLWMSTTITYRAGTVDHSLIFSGASSSVTELGFGIDTSGTLQLWGSDDGGANSFHDTSETGIEDGTYLVLIRATKGTGTSPSNSTIDLWFDPTDTTSAASLGTATFTTGTDSKFGRDSQDFNTVAVGAAGIDEIRLVTEFSELNLVPEASTFVLIGLAGLALLRRRRA